MKICQIIGDSAFGGGSFIVIEIVKGLVAEGHQVVVVATDSVFVSKLEEAGAEVEKLSCIWRPINPIRDLIGMFRLAKYLRSQSFDVVHTHTSKAGFVGRMAAKLAAVSHIIHTIHGFAFHEGSNPLVIWAVSLLERIASYWCDTIVTVSNFHRSWAAQLGIASLDKLRCIPNGISVDEEEDVAGDVRSEFGILDDDFLIVSAGRIAAGKRLSLLIDVVAELSESLKRNVKVLLPGAGPMLEELVAEIDSRNLGHCVILPGFRSDIQSFVHAADVIALPSEREGLSIALLEAMAAGKPVVASRIGSNIEVTRDGECAKLFSPNDIGGLKQCLADVAQDPEAARQVGRDARVICVENYTLERMKREYLNLYQEFDLANKTTRDANVESNQPQAGM